MNAHNFLELIGFLNGLDYHSERKTKDGKTEITQDCITYILNNICDKSNLMIAFEYLSQKQHLQMEPGFLNSSTEVVGYLNGWIDPEKINS